MGLELLPVLVAGVLAGLAMFVAQSAIGSGSGAPAFVVGYWSGLLELRGGAATIGGFVVHLLVSVGIAAIYALAFSLGAVADAGWAWGFLGGVIHWVAAGAFVGLVPAAAAARAPGPFGRQLGQNGALAFLASHLVFGLVVGSVYLLLHSAGGLDAAV